MIQYENEIKPCPECKGTDIRYQCKIGVNKSADKFNYFCNNCGYKTATKSTIELADKAWQDREAMKIKEK